MEYIFIIAGGLLSLCLYFYLLFNFDSKIQRTVIYFISVISAILLTKLILNIQSFYISENLGETYIILYSYYLTMILFLAFSTVLNIIFKINTAETGKLTGAPLILFLAVSKIGCYVNGCCYAVIGGCTLPLNIIESGLAIIIFILIMTNRIKTDIIILLTYSIFRLITDFFKINFRYENLFGITISQIFYISVIMVVIVLITIKRFRRKSI